MKQLNANKNEINYICLVMVTSKLTHFNAYFNV